MKEKSRKVYGAENDFFMVHATNSHFLHAFNCSLFVTSVKNKRSTVYSADINLTSAHGLSEYMSHCAYLIISISPSSLNLCVMSCGEIDKVMNCIRNNTGRGK